MRVNESFIVNSGGSACLVAINRTCFQNFLHHLAPPLPRGVMTSPQPSSQRGGNGNQSEMGMGVGQSFTSESRVW